MYKFQKQQVYYRLKTDQPIELMVDHVFDILAQPKIQTIVFPVVKQVSVRLLSNEILPFFENLES